MSSGCSHGGRSEEIKEAQERKRGVKEKGSKNKEEDRKTGEKGKKKSQKTTGKMKRGGRNERNCIISVKNKEADGRMRKDKEKHDDGGTVMTDQTNMN